MPRRAWERLFAAMGLALALSGTPAAGDETSKRFTLNKHIPADVFVYVHGTHNPEREFLCRYYAPVWEALKKADLPGSIYDLIVAEMDEDEEAELEAAWGQITALIDGVNWGGLVAGEVVFAGRWNQMVPEFVLFFRGDEELAGENAKALAKFMQTIDQYDTDDEAVDLLETEDATCHGWTLKVKDGLVNMEIGGEQKSVRPSLTLMHLQGGVICISAAFHDPTLLGDCLDLMNGKGEMDRLADSAEYKKLMGELPKAEDAICWVNVDGIFASLDGNMDRVSKEEPDAAEVLGIVRKALDAFRLIGQVASVEYTDGYRTYSESVCSLAPKATESPLYEAFFDRPMFTRYDQYLPEDTTNFSLWNGIDLIKTYDAVMDFIAEEVPDGEDIVADWEEIQTDIDFNLVEDLLSWLDLQVISVTMGTASMYAPPDFVLMFHVWDEQMAADSLTRGLEALETLCENIGQPLSVTEVEVTDEAEFHRVAHPMLMMFRPVVGVANGWLVIGSDADSIQKCFECAAGEADSLAKSKRYQQEGLVPDGPFASLNWKDMSNFGDQAAQMMGMMGFFGGMIPPSEPGAGQIRAVFGILTDLAPVLQEMNFTLSTASLSTVKGDLMFTKTVTNYKPPKPESEEEEDQE